MIDRARIALPAVGLPRDAARCRSLACNNLRPSHSNPFCRECWDKVPRAWRPEIESLPRRNPRRVALVQAAAELLTFSAEDGSPFCWICGCTEDAACEGGCYWASDEKHPDRDVCSRCVEASSQQP